ncbi:hypothetical protein ACFVH6_04925 [Spirillospora sp. NPDC127200]
MDERQADEVFFREWRARAPGSRRDLGRARALARALGAASPDAPVLAVVGSKGKGTAAAYASAVLAAAGRRVLTVTSPGLRDNRDRIRVDGRSLASLVPLAERLDEAIGALPPPAAGHLAPSGLFLLAGVLHARDVAADVLVLEAGMGGRSDEVSLFPPAALAITPVFGEHLGVLGDTPAAIAAEKAGLAAPATRAVVSAPQPPEIRAVLDRTVAARTGGAAVEYADPFVLPEALLPEGLGRVSAEVGGRTALRLLGTAPPPERLREVLGSVVLPGRLSWHSLPGLELLADSAIDGTGVAAALAAALDRWGGIDRVLLCLPDHKDLDGAIAALDGLPAAPPVTFVRLPHQHLRFTRPLPPSWQVLDAADLRLGDLSGRVAALGTVYFIGLVLALVDADTTRLF